MFGSEVPAAQSSTSSPAVSAPPPSLQNQELEPGSHPVARRALDALGVYVLVVGAWATWASLRNEVNLFDEGLILTNANLILGGQAPHRDFYTNYPPGIFLMVAGLWKLFGISGALPRLLGVLLHLIISVLGGRIAGRIAGRSFSTLACGTILLAMSALGVAPYAWVAAMAMSFAALEIFLSLSPGRSKVLFLLCGAAWGGIGCLRHDLFIYLCLTLAAIGLVWAVQNRAWPGHAFRVRLGWIVLGAAIPLILVWAPVIARAGLRQVLDDLWLDQVRWVLPARKLPMPSLLSLTPITPWSFRLPAFAAELLPSAVLLLLVAPVCAVLGIILAKNRSLRARTALGGCAALAIAALPQALGRTDLHHAIYSLPPALTIGVALAERIVTRRQTNWRRIAAGNVALLLLLFPLRGLLRPISEIKLWLPPMKERLVASNAIAQERQITLNFIAQNTKPGEGIFVGNRQHRLVTFNDVGLYYLADRPGVTRYLQFDPNLVTRLKVQKQIADDLEVKQVKTIVLLQGGYWAEPNASRRLGASWLDDYLKAHYDIVGAGGNYLWLRRKGHPLETPLQMP